MNKKFTKDQIQKMALSGLLMIGLIYCYFTFLISPLGKQDKTNATAIEELEGNIAKAKSEIKRSASVQAQAATAEETLAQVNDMIPDGSPLAWFPARTEAFFTRHNLQNVKVKNASLDSQKDVVMRDYMNATWNVDIPQTSMTTLGITLAGLENEDKLAEITRLQISTLADAPEKQHVTLNLLTLIK